MTDVRTAQARMILVAALGIGAGWGCATGRKLTLDAIYGPNPIDFDGDYPRVYRWMPDGSLATEQDNQVMQMAAPDFSAATPVDLERMHAALRAHAEFKDAGAAKLPRFPERGQSWLSERMIQRGDALFLVNPATGTARTLADKDELRKEAAWRPKSRSVSYVRDNNLFLLGEQGAVQQLTYDGSPTLLNGLLDWVYQEELYGRGDYRGYWWRDDDACIAFLQLDESRVPQYTILDEVTPHPAIETMRYPKAGDPNPVVRLGVLHIPLASTRAGGSAATGQTMNAEAAATSSAAAPASQVAASSGLSAPVTWMDLSTYAGQEILIVRVAWAPNGKVVYQVQNREQTWLDLNEADPSSGVSRRLLRETTGAWVNRLEDPHWLKDGTFIWQSERDGYRHLYHLRADGSVIRQITSGAWEARELEAVDPGQEWLFVRGTLDGPAEEHLYRVRLAGGAVERLTQPGFSHAVDIDPSCAYFVDTYSNLRTPPRVELRRTDGALVRVLLDNPAPAAKELRRPKVEIVHPVARDGTELNAVMIRPANYSPLRRYPVWAMVYGGPESPQVENRFPNRSDRWLEQYVAQQGYVVWVCDPRSASGEGAKLAWTAYKRLGAQELQDIEDSLQWLVDRGIADPKRIGIWGFSYGGYLTAYALTHSKMFKLGIAGGPVTDWRNYDSIYTERYMLQPKDNAAGYDSASVVKAAGNLSGRLLLVHGLMDENVHFQNTVELIRALQNAGKQFDVMPYPGNRHGIRTVPRHFAELRLRYILENL